MAIEIPYIILFILLFLFLLRFFKKPRYNKHKVNIVKANKILKKVNSFQYPGQKINYLRKIDPFVFEEFLLSAFRNRGFKIRRNKRYTGDGGIDGIVFDPAGKKYLVQAKRYSSYINPEHVKTFQELVLKTKSHGGFFIHTGKTGKASYLHLQKNIKIISGNVLLDLIAETNT